jgi:hypothetical protein
VAVALVVVVVVVVLVALGQMLWVKTQVEHPQPNPRLQWHLQQTLLSQLVLVVRETQAAQIQYFLQ